ncbi:MAG TPA: M23 family metallopeptidase [Terriglobales bacterium]|nr:M23 family metallopeptidase [Terriglobales bacterium]
MRSFDAPPTHRIRNLFSVIVVLGLAVVIVAWARGSAPKVTAVDLPAAIGQHKLVTIRVEAPDGVATVHAFYRQNGKTIELGSQTLSPYRWFTDGAAPQVVDFSVQAGKLDHAGLSDGAVTLVVEATSADLRGAKTTFSRDLSIQSTPPRVYALSTQQYIVQGGAEMVVYHVSQDAGAAINSGVEMAGVFFKGYPLPHAIAPGTMFALFAYPYDAPAGTEPHLVARDAAGNQAEAGFPVKTFPQTFRERPLTIDDNFIEHTVMPIIANTPALHDQHDPVKNFLMVNRDLRRTDEQDLVDAAKLTAAQFFWHGAFTQLSNSKVEAEFGDRRAYMYHGQVIDHETHLGYDLAAVRHTPVKAANAGRVIWAKYFGIYGNCVLIDHGYGLMSLYGHLNDFEVKAGDLVTQGQLIAHSDSTGLAAGDHLHFSMLLDGVQVNPVEWWDPHWIQGHITSKIQQFTASATASLAR